MDIIITSIQEGETAIFFAARNGHVDAVKLLVENGAVVDHKNKVAMPVILLLARVLPLSTTNVVEQNLIGNYIFSRT